MSFAHQLTNHFTPLTGDDAATPDVIPSIVFFLLLIFIFITAIFFSKNDKENTTAAMSELKVAAPATLVTHAHQQHIQGLEAETDLPKLALQLKKSPEELGVEAETEFQELALESEKLPEELQRSLEEFLASSSAKSSSAKYIYVDWLLTNRMIALGSASTATADPRPHTDAGVSPEDQVDAHTVSVKRGEDGVAAKMGTESITIHIKSAATTTQVVFTFSIGHESPTPPLKKKEEEASPSPLEVSSDNVFFYFVCHFFFFFFSCRFFLVYFLLSEG